MSDTNIRDDIYLFALQNAVKHKSVPKAGAILGSVMGAHPELRPQAKEILRQCLLRSAKQNSQRFHRR